MQKMNAFISFHATRLKRIDERQNVGMMEWQHLPECFSYHYNKFYMRHSRIVEAEACCYIVRTICFEWLDICVCMSVTQFGQYIYVYIFLAKYTHRRVEVIATLMVSIAQIEHEEKSLGLLTVEWPLYFVHFTFLVLPPCESFSTAFSKPVWACVLFIFSLTLSLSRPFSRSWNGVQMAINLHYVLLKCNPCSWNHR